MMREGIFKLEEVVSDLVECFRIGKEVLKREYLKMLEGGWADAEKVMWYLDKMGKQLAMAVNLFERLQKLRKEISESEEVMEKVSYMILRLSERERLRVAEAIDSGLERDMLMERYGRLIELEVEKIENMRKVIERFGLEEVLKDVRSKEELFLVVCGLGEVEDIWFERDGERIFMVAKVSGLNDRKMLEENVFWWDLVQVCGKDWVVMRKEVYEEGVIEGDVAELEE